MSISVVILGAGKGTRMKSDIPKVLHKISGKQMIFYSIDVAKEISDDIIVVLHHQSDKIAKEINRYYENIKIHIQDVENFPGTGGAVRGINPKYKRTLILNGDMPLITKKSLIPLTLNNDADINISILKLNNPFGYGRVVIKDGKVKEIVEEKDSTAEQKRIKTVNGGIYSIDSLLLKSYIERIDNNNAQKEYYLTDVIKIAVNEKKIVLPIVVKEEEFKGVNSKVDLAKAEEIMQDRIKKELMMSGVTMHLPNTIYIDSRVTFKGESTLENGVTILGKSHIENSYIKSHSVIEDAKIVNSSVGPMARLRPLTEIQNTHIGNFVEIKKSKLDGVKAGHLAYIGDSIINEGSNIGAGVITCNYDGKRKYKTIIGKNVFVGSDTQLIAPVKIEDDVIIGAGTTVTKDIAKGNLAISRPPLKTVKDFFYKFFRS